MTRSSEGLPSAVPPRSKTKSAGQRARHGEGQLDVHVSGFFSLAGRVAVVTGASSGLGACFAESLAEAGADVVLVARRRDRLEKTAAVVREAGRRGLPVAADVTSHASCQEVARAAITAFGRIDILVNNAGIGTAVPTSRESPEQFRAVIETNLMGAYWMAQACGVRMKPGSSIVNISSVLGLTTAGLPQAAYTASKAALLGLTRDLASQWSGRRGIRVNALAPGFFETEMTEQYRPGYMDAQISRVLLGRCGEPKELGATLVWLTSAAAGYVTGQTVVVDGGFTLT
jgi:NAD(P)-dependent dehydrogenase (short-subunit alcohol dehydrogenase family)